jgi:hypothetical protein
MHRLYRTETAWGVNLFFLWAKAAKMPTNILQSPPNNNGNA